MKKIFSLVVALLTLVSCSEDFLNLTPQYYPCLADTPRRAE